jgi:hypothetical protein
VIINVYHHMQAAPRSCAAWSATPRGARVINVDWTRRRSSAAPKRACRARFLRDAPAGRAKLWPTHVFLPHQYFLELRRRA